MVMENLGFHLKRIFVVHDRHLKNSEVRVLKKMARLVDEEKKKNVGVDFGVGISCKAACLKEKQP
jgi:hypothetical protein